MIAFTLTTAGEPQFATSDHLDLRPPTQIVAEAKPPPQQTQKWRFSQPIIPLDEGRTLLRLRESLTLNVDPKTMEFEVQDWGLRMPCDKVEDLPRQIARRFLTLFSKADHGAIDSKERGEWLKILDKVDFTQFSIDRSAPHYVEGTLVKKHPLTIEWHDGTIEHMHASLASIFYPLDPGDNFSAFVKIGKANHTVGVERLSFIPA